MICFGTVPSRRFGRSLGINNIISPKVCSYSCVYCQVGMTERKVIARENFYEPESICSAVQKHLKKLEGIDKPDYLTFVANGEPTLDINLGRSVRALKFLKIPIAVITNASLLSLEQVRVDLSQADCVSVKVDAPDPNTWKKINNPHECLDFASYLKGLREFRSGYKGRLLTETMLIKGINDDPAILRQIASLIGGINPEIAYLTVPTRPPALSSVKGPDEQEQNEAYQIYLAGRLNARLIPGFEGTDTGYTGNAGDDIINMCAVHPIREDTMKELLEKDGADPAILETLIENKLIRRVEYKSDIFYIRQLNS